MTTIAKTKMHDFLPKIAYFSFWSLFAAFCAGYSNATIPEIIFFVLMIVIVFSYYRLERSKRIVATRSQWAFAILLGSIITFFYIIGKHVHVTDVYTGTISGNYLTKYSFVDLLAFVVLDMGVSIILAKLFSSVRTGSISLSSDKISLKCALLGAIIFVIPSLVYLVIYYPGFIFPDSTSSINQALGLAPLNNHFPVYFTIFIKLCFRLSALLGHGPQFGCVIFVLFQTVIYALTASFIVNWLEARFRLDSKLTIIASIYFLMPYFAASNNMLRTDGIFSCMVILLIPLTIDYFYVKQPKREKVLLLVALFVVSLVAIIWRNNGIYVISFCAVTALLYLAFHRHRRELLYASTALAAVVVGIIITGPLENVLGVSKSESKVESYGVFINQMARVAAYDGDMTKSDREYMNRLLPIDEYKTKYRPSAIDNLKWDASFDKSVLEHNFWKHYLSMLVRNPRNYFEAWIMNVHGYLCLNIPGVNNYRSSVSDGNLSNVVNNRYLQSKDIDVINVEESSGSLPWRIFNYSAWSIPGSWIAYLVLILIAVIVLSGRVNHGLILAFSPLIAVWGTMLVASPIRYWARYIYSLQLAVPIICLLFTKMIKWPKNRVSGVIE